MRVGTKSLLFGGHQFIFHPIYVYKAWKILYGKPNFKELICIIIHDWGYFHKSNLDGIDGTSHPLLGGKIAKILFGESYYTLCVGHSRTYSKQLRILPSKLCWADKLSVGLQNRSMYLFLCRLTDELKEYRTGNITDSELYDKFVPKILESIPDHIRNKYNTYRKEINK